ncbi:MULTISPECIES: DUF5064 family protein [Pseudomonas]|uniref:DUF5064 family protein n=1 Tax=Pseudomonas brassicacearum TaxID=930166 RepID=A0AAJ3KXE5_9PSED|nr:MULTISPECIES: DUF5064 family protein [Pseudomonas]NUT83161.1 DUF5064 family protein [Pseudomonas brassicacearum]QGA50158.1 DUF5064 family protein [Pseudomonas brassicacearum]
MATFTPGHLHIKRDALNRNDVSYDLNIDYEVHQDPKEGRGMLFTMHGSIQGRDMEEKFFLPKDQAYNFGSNVTQIAEMYGIPKVYSAIGSMHKNYDLVFEDVRVQLGMKSGDPVKPEHLE